MKLLITPIVAIIVIGVLIKTALDNDINGVMFSGAMIAIAGLGGYRIKAYRDSKIK